MALEPAVLEKAYAAERKVAVVRWAVIVFNSVVYALFLDGSLGTVSWMAWAVIAVANAYAVYVLAAKPYKRFPGMMSVYFTSVTDAALIALWIFATGNAASPFFVLWYVSIVAIAFRFSVERTIVVAVFYSTIYMLTLAAGGQLLLDPPRLGVEIGYIFLVGWLAGLIGQETYQQTRAKLEMAELAEAVGSLTEELKPQAIAQRLVDTAMTVTGADRGALFLFSEPSGALSTLHAEGLSRAYLDRVEALYVRLPGAGLLKGATHVHVEDAATDPATAPVHEAVREEGIHSFMVLPLLLEDQPFGALALYRDRVQRFSDDEIGIGRSLASHGAVALEKARLVDELRDSEERWRTLVTHAPNIIIMIDRNRTIRFVNRTPEGITREEALGGSVYDWVPASHTATMRDALDAVFGQGSSTTYEVPGAVGGGETAWYATRAGPIYEDGRVAGALLISMDITERKRTEEELQRSNADLEQFAYMASHDLQEPLRMVTSYVQLLQRRCEAELDADAKTYMGYAVEGAERMQTMIRDLLKYSQVNVEEHDLEPLDLNEVVDEVLSEMAATIEDASAEVEVQNLPVLKVDGTQVSHVFQNLLTNALKFRGPEPPRIGIRAKEREDSWEVIVEDNGIGIDPQYAEKIFNLFQRLNPRQEYPGTGIGLAICRRVIDRHGGRIWVEPVDDAPDATGSRFHFTFPKPISRPQSPRPETSWERDLAEDPVETS